MTHRHDVRTFVRICTTVAAVTLAAAVAVAGCAHRTTVPRAGAQKRSADPNAIPTTAERAHVALTLANPDRLRLVVIGDTGAPGEIIGTWRRSIRAEAKDAVLVTGDLLYPEAPLCPGGRITEAGRTMLDAHLGDILSGLGAPTYLLLGNHDVSHTEAEVRRERCVLNYIAAFDDLILPATNYSVDFGSVVLAIVDTNKLDAAAASVVAAAFDGHTGIKLLSGHHTLKTYHDKQNQDFVRPWLETHKIRPDMYLNGHAHLLQFGVYDDIPALTSGTGRYPRERPVCPGSCGPGQLWGVSVPGYAVVEIARAADGRQTISVEFKDAEGQPLWAWASETPAPGATK